jgi:hypothetical protein
LLRKGGRLVVTTECPNTLSFNIGQTAAGFSILAGVLAGFSFTGIGYLLTAGITHIFTRNSVGRVLAAAFLSLVLVSLNYASLAGAPQADGSAVSEEALLGPGFAAASALVLYTVVLILEAIDRQPVRSELEETQPTGFAWRPAGQWPQGLPATSASIQASIDAVSRSTMRGMVGRWAPAILTLLVVDSVSDYENLRNGSTGSFGQITLFGLGLCAVQVLIALTIYPWWARRRAHPWAEDKVFRSVRNVTIIAFSVTSISASAFVIYDTLGDTCSLLPPAFPIGGLLLTFLLTTGMAYQLARSQPR